MNDNGNRGDSYSEFLERKSQLGGQYGFKPLWMPKFPNCGDPKAPSGGILQFK